MQQATKGRKICNITYRFGSVHTALALGWRHQAWPWLQPQYAAQCPLGLNRHPPTLPPPPLVMGLYNVQYMSSPSAKLAQSVRHGFDFFGPKGQSLRLLLFQGPTTKFRFFFSGPTPFQWSLKWICPHQKKALCPTPNQQQVH